MSAEPQGDVEQHVNGILAAYLEAERTGTAPDREELLRRHLISVISGIGG
jgi:hypothetical protein